MSKKKESKYRIDLLSFDDIADEVKEKHELSDYDEECLFLVVYRNNEIMEIYCDRMAPEDASFGHSLNWISMELKRAYELGYTDGQQDLAKQVFGDKVYKFLESTRNVLKKISK